MVSVGSLGSVRSLEFCSPDPRGEVSQSLRRRQIRSERSAAIVIASSL